MLKLYGGYKMPILDKYRIDYPYSKAKSYSSFDPISADKYNRAVLESLGRAEQRIHAPDIARTRALKKSLSKSLSFIPTSGIDAGIERAVLPSDLRKVATSKALAVAVTALHEHPSIATEEAVARLYELPTSSLPLATSSSAYTSSSLPPYLKAPRKGAPSLLRNHVEYIGIYKIPKQKVNSFVKVIEKMEGDFEKNRVIKVGLEQKIQGQMSDAKRRPIYARIDLLTTKSKEIQINLKELIDEIDYSNRHLIHSILASSLISGSTKTKIEARARSFNDLHGSFPHHRDVVSSEAGAIFELPTQEEIQARQRIRESGLLHTTSHKGISAVDWGTSPSHTPTGISPHKKSSSSSSSSSSIMPEEIGEVIMPFPGEVIMPFPSSDDEEDGGDAEGDVDWLNDFLGDGRGFRHLRPRIKKVVRRTNKKVKGGIWNPITAVKGLVNRAKSTAQTLFSSEGRNDLPPSVKNILAQHGNEPIQSMIIVRTPLGKVLSGVLNVASLGQMGKLPYDKLFHLYLLVTLPSGQYAVEKEAVVSIKKAGSERAGAEEMPIYSFPPMTLNSMMDNTRNYMSPNKFINYSAYDNNCQTFISSILLSNNINDSNYQKFIKQDTGSVFSSNPYFRKLANTVTDLGAKINVIQEGGRRKKTQRTHKSHKSPEHIMILKQHKPKSLSELIASGSC